MDMTNAAWGAVVSGVCFILLHTAYLIWFLGGFRQQMAQQGISINTLTIQAREDAKQRSEMQLVVVQQKEILHGLKATVEAYSLDRYRGTDAVRDLKLIDVTIQSLTHRIESLESWRDKHENKCT